MLLNRMFSSKKPLLLLENITARTFLIKTFILLFLGTVFFLLPKEYLGDSYPICLSRIIFDKHCIGCGTTRAVWSVLHFKFADAFEYNKLIIVTFPLITGCAISWIFKSRKSNPVAHNDSKEKV